MLLNKFIFLNVTAPELPSRPALPAGNSAPGNQEKMKLLQASMFELSSDLSSREALARTRLLFR